MKRILLAILAVTGPAWPCVGAVQTTDDPPRRDYFYWELHEGASIRAVRFGNRKAVRNGPSRPIELYDLKTDVGETNDLAAEKPELVAKARALMKEARVDDPNWPLRDRRPPRSKPRRKPQAKRRAPQ